MPPHHSLVCSQLGFAPLARGRINNVSNLQPHLATDVCLLTIVFKVCRSSGEVPATPSLSQLCKEQPVS